MNIRYTLLIVPAVFIPLALIAQGPLTPPGAPAPAMKTLQQIEPRTDLATLAGDASALFIIDKPGSFYLSANVSVGAGQTAIAIHASDVSLDLNGFTVTGASAGAKGIELRNGTSGVTVRNGIISAFTSAPGILLPGGSTAASVKLSGLSIRGCAGGILLNGASGVTVEDVRVTGSTSHGIDLGNKGLVTRCTVENMAVAASGTIFGIRAELVNHCMLLQNANSTGNITGISAGHVSECEVIGTSGANGSNAGISAAVVEHCRVTGLSVTTSGTPVTGISASNHAAHCVVSNIGTTGTGAPIGIFSDSVSDCQVNTLGSAASTGTNGISSAGQVSGCTVTNVGHPSTTADVNGIIGAHVTNCRINTVQGNGSLLGVSAEHVSQCHVVTLVQGSTTAGGSAVGITARQIEACLVTNITSGNSVAGTGFSGYRHASGCTVLGITNTGTGITQGFAPTFGGLTLNCVASGMKDFGVVCGQVGCVVRGCTFELGGTTSGSAIVASGASCVVENNTVRNAATGINVTGANGLIVHNRITTCTTKITASATSQTGPVINAAGNIASTNPWANFTD